MQSFSVVGPRRIGKSSLLFYIANRYDKYLGPSSKYRFAYIDLQDASTLTPEGLFKKILIELGVSPNNNAKLTLAKFQDAITALKEGGALPVILLDEFEEVMHHAGLTAPDIFDSWRYLLNNNLAAFITASKSSLNELARAKQYTSPFFNIFTFLPLGEFTDDEALELIRRCDGCTSPFADSERNQMNTLAGNHPCKLQLAGSLIYEMKARDGNVDWDKLSAAFHQQLERIDLEEPVIDKTTSKNIQSFFKMGLTSTRYLGRARLDLLGRDKAADSSAFILGWLIVAIILALAMGWIGIDFLTGWYSYSTGAGKSE